MQDSDNEFSLDLFIDYRIQDTPFSPTYRLEGGHDDPYIMDGAGWMADFNTKTFIITKPTKFVDLYSGISDVLCNNIDFMAYKAPILPISRELFELVNGWTFKNDESRKNMRDAGWREGDDQWICIKPVGCGGDISGLGYKWDWGFCGEYHTFDNIANLTLEDSGLVSEPIRVMGNATQLSININGKGDFRDMESLYGSKTLKAGVIVIPVSWCPPAPEFNTEEPNRVTFNVSGISPLDEITIMSYTNY